MTNFMVNMLLIDNCEQYRHETISCLNTCIFITGQPTLYVTCESYIKYLYANCAHPSLYAAVYLTKFAAPISIQLLQEGIFKSEHIIGTRSVAQQPRKKGVYETFINLYFTSHIIIRVSMFFQQLSQLRITPCRSGCLHIDRHCGADTIHESTPRSKTRQKKRRPENLQEITIIEHHCQVICISQSQT